MPVEEEKVEEIITEVVSNDIDDSIKIVDKTIECSSTKINLNGRRRSQIWHHFEKMHGGKTARCHYCLRVLSIAAGSISNLLRHLRKKHPESVVNFTYCTPAVVDQSPGIVEVDGTFSEPEEPVTSVQSEQVQTPPRTTYNPPKKFKQDTESIIRKDHCYYESTHTTEPVIFGQFIQGELDKFNSELLRRQCKREILQVLIRHQLREDSFYESQESNYRWYENRTESLAWK